MGKDEEYVKSGLIAALIMTILNHIFSLFAQGYRVSADFLGLVSAVQQQNWVGACLAPLSSLILLTEHIFQPYSVNC
ncbi:MAG: hypothetical protein QXK20_05745 [Nitrososphaerales archaeon]